MSTALTWRISETVNALYAAWACWTRPQQVAPEVSEALAEPLARLRAALEEERVPASSFWWHVFPAAALASEDPQRLAEITVVKSIGQLEAPLRVPRFARVLRELRQRATPELAAPALDFLQAAWQRHGSALVTTIGQLTEPELVPESASVIGVTPITDGGGLAVLSGNVAVIEAVETDAWPDLPEVVRLAWLVSQLQLDLPGYSEQLPAARRGMAAELAMLPPALEAVRRCRITEASLADLLGRVGGSWPTPPLEPAAQGNLLSWWSVYQSRHPTFALGLSALDRAFADRHS
jgi:hypothetical protein